nr:immunoglobulin heavy chain junction region [Macaca mulatta]MOX60563.1 immunoglobulin heavy chain junction region [Macaca mulatta]MOX61572.1 immunoglobulin heavy chain junction region [Macaca mulatta]MOX61602.1 immunoglobulin heavy chain junction region [Macaca mulatta]MOX61646.1 immunoglobulin heavy chain junction region [Macaca mulatta]
CARADRGSSIDYW